MTEPTGYLEAAVLGRGATKAKPIDKRVLCATEVSLGKAGRGEVKEGVGTAVVQVP